MIYNGKEIYTEDTFDFDIVKPGDYVNRKVVDNIADCLPPLIMRADYMQMGEPYSFKTDEKTGHHRSTYGTFKIVHGGKYDEQVWEYCGHCFLGESVERGIDIID